MNRRTFLRILAAGPGLFLLPASARPAAARPTSGALRPAWRGLYAVQTGAGGFILRCGGSPAYEGARRLEPEGGRLVVAHKGGEIRCD